MTFLLLGIAETQIRLLHMMLLNLSTQQVASYAIPTHGISPFCDGFLANGSRLDRLLSTQQHAQR